MVPETRKDCLQAERKLNIALRTISNMQKENKKGANTMNEKKLFIINPQILGVAKAIYKGGAYVNASNSAFLRGLLEDVSNGIKKAVKK